MAAAARAETVSAQRLAVTSWLASRGIKFDDVRAVGKAKETGKVPAATVSFFARLGDGEAGEALVAGVRMEFRGDDGIVAVVRSPWRANASGDPAVFAATAAAASCGGTATTTADPKGTGCVVALAYPGRNDHAPGAACADVHRAVANLAFARGLEAASRGTVGVVAMEPLSVVVAAKGGATVRVAWVGGANAGGGMAVAPTPTRGAGENRWEKTRRRGRPRRRGSGISQPSAPRSSSDAMTSSSRIIRAAPASLALAAGISLCSRRRS